MISIHVEVLIYAVCTFGSEPQRRPSFLHSSKSLLAEEQLYVPFISRVPISGMSLTTLFCWSLADVLHTLDAQTRSSSISKTPVMSLLSSRTFQVQSRASHGKDCPYYWSNCPLMSLTGISLGWVVLRFYSGYSLCEPEINRAGTIDKENGQCAGGSIQCEQAHDACCTTPQ